MDLVKKNQKLYNKDLPLIISDVKYDDVVKEVREPSYIKVREKFYIFHVFFNPTVFAELCIIIVLGTAFRTKFHIN